MARVLPDDANLNSKVIADVNGETKAVMEHARKLQAAGTDTSIDEPWEVDPSLALNDSYVLFTSKLSLGWLESFPISSRARPGWQRDCSESGGTPHSPHGSRAGID